MKKPTTAAKKPAPKKPAPARKPSNTGVPASPSIGSLQATFVERFAFLSDDRLTLAALARRFYPDLEPRAAAAKLHGHLSATAAARSLTAEEEAKLLALVEDFALFLLQKCQPKVWEPAFGNIRSMDLIWADNSKRHVIAVDKPNGDGRFTVLLPNVQAIDGGEAQLIPHPRPEPIDGREVHYMSSKPEFDRPIRPSFSPEDFGSRR